MLMRDITVATASRSFWLAGSAAANCALMALRGAAADSSVSPGFNWPTRKRLKCRGSLSWVVRPSFPKSFWSESYTPVGTKTSGINSTIDPPNPRWATPTTWNDRLFSVIVWFSTSFLPPSRCQRG